MTPLLALAWIGTAVAAVLALFLILVVIVLTVSMIRKAFEKPKNTDHNLIIHNPVSRETRI